MRLWQRGQRERQADAETEHLKGLLAAFSAALAVPCTEAPPALLAAMRWPHHHGEAVRLHAAGRDLTAVIGPEGVDAGMIFAAITAAARASRDCPGVVRLEPATLAPGLRAVAVRGGGGVALWLPASLDPLLRRAAVRRALAGSREYRRVVLGLLPLPIGVPALRHLLWAGAATAAVTGAVVLAPSQGPVPLRLAVPGQGPTAAPQSPRASIGHPVAVAQPRAGGSRAGVSAPSPAAASAPVPVQQPSPLPTVTASASATVSASPSGTGTCVKVPPLNLCVTVP